MLIVLGCVICAPLPMLASSGSTGPTVEGQLASWLSLRICLSKARAGTMRRSVLTRPALGPAVYRSFGFGSVAAATITLATVAGSSPSSINPAITSSKVWRCCRVDRQRGVGPHHVRIEPGAGVGGLDEQHSNAVLADFVVQGFGVALDRVLGRDVGGHVGLGDEPVVRMRC